MEIGELSAIWDRVFHIVYIFRSVNMMGRKSGKRFTCFHFCEKAPANVDDLLRGFWLCGVGNLLLSVLWSENEGSRGAERLVRQQAHLGKKNSAIRRLASSILRVPGIQNSSGFKWGGVSEQRRSERASMRTSSSSEQSSSTSIAPSPSCSLRLLRR